MAEGSHFSSPVFSQIAVTLVVESSSKARAGLGGHAHTSVLQQVAKGACTHTKPLAKREMTGQDMEQDMISCRTSFSLGLYLKQHLKALHIH